MLYHQQEQKNPANAEKTLVKCDAIVDVSNGRTRNCVYIRILYSKLRLYSRERESSCCIYENMTYKLQSYLVMMSIILESVYIYIYIFLKIINNS